MPSTELAKVLSVALDVQAVPYPGIHVAGGMMVAVNHVMLIAAKFNETFLRGEGAISPKAAKVLAALAEGTWIGSIAVEGNRVTVTARGTRYEEKIGEVADEYCEVTLPEFYCPRVPIRRMLAVLTDESRGWVQVVENPRLKNIKEWSAKEYVALVKDPRDGEELFRSKDTDDAHWYSVAQLRRGLRLFVKNARLTVRRNRDGWLSFNDQWGGVFAVTPFVKRD
jgi:hypothetical protein